MQYERTPLDRLFAWLSRKEHHRFRCFGCHRDIIVSDRFHEHAQKHGCDWCGDTLIPHDQSTGLCCPGCPAELLSQGEPDRGDHDEGIFAFECDHCLTESVWIFGAAPFAIRLNRDPTDLEPLHQP